jgi:hypothetical protein
VRADRENCGLIVSGSLVVGLACARIRRYVHKRQYLSKRQYPVDPERS